MNQNVLLIASALFIAPLASSAQTQIRCQSAQLPDGAVVTAQLAETSSNQFVYQVRESNGRTPVRMVAQGAALRFEFTTGTTISNSSQFTLGISRGALQTRFPAQLDVSGISTQVICQQEEYAPTEIVSSAASSAAVQCSPGQERVFYQGHYFCRTLKNVPMN